jgi:uncharacterized protein
MTTADQREKQKSDFDATIQSYAGLEVGAAVPGPDLVNAPMIRHWCEAMGDRLPIYTNEEAAAASAHGGLVAPPTMLQAWVMRGLDVSSGRPDSVYSDLLNLLDAAGYTSTVAVNCEQEYERYLRPGDRLTMKTTIDTISPEKKTGLGTGYFVTSRQSYFDADNALVGTMLFRILKFRPPEKASGPEASPAPAAADVVPAPVTRPKRPRPTPTDDGAFFFEAARAGKLMVQRCSACGHFQFPPHAACQQCQSFDTVPTEVSGKGEIYSFVVTHYPQVPAFDYPLPVALIQLDEGPRLVSNIIGTDPTDLAIGMGVTVTFVECDDELTLPMFKVANV